MDISWRVWTVGEAEVRAKITKKKQIRYSTASQYGSWRRRTPSGDYHDFFTSRDICDVIYCAILCFNRSEDFPRADPLKIGPSQWKFTSPLQCTPQWAAPHCKVIMNWLAVPSIGFNKPQLSKTEISRFWVLWTQWHRAVHRDNIHGYTIKTAHGQRIID